MDSLGEFRSERQIGGGAENDKDDPESDESPPENFVEPPLARIMNSGYDSEEIGNAVIRKQ